MPLLLKRIIDVAGSLVGLTLLSPLFLIAAVLIKVDSPGPVFFRQERVGKDGRRFRIFKFRSMVDGAARLGSGIYVSEGDPRITRVGRFLRRASLDELPQLINVLRGEMSLVGPRPTLAYQVEKYTARQRRRLLVKPGLTGWAQVKGRNSLSWPEKIELDLYYIDRWSLWMDLYILLLTPLAVFRRDTVYRRGGPDEISRQAGAEAEGGERSSL